MLPLEGVRILDLSRAMAGPFCTMMLGDLGADVVKVERPGTGDESRGWGPPFVGRPYGPYPGESAYFLSANRNKRSLTVNLKDPAGQQIVRDLAGQSDVLVENFRTGDLDAMGLGYASLHALYPRLVYCSVSGYGRTGPYAERPGYDFVLQAEGGLMGITGPEEGPPYRLGIPIIDITSGMFAAAGVLAALRARDLCGEGQLVDVSLLDSEAALLTNVASNYLVAGEGQRRLGNAHPSITPYEAFPARDAWFALAVGNDRQWQTLCEAIGRTDLALDPRYARNRDRLAHRDGLRAVLEDCFRQRDSAEWLEILARAELPCGPISSIAEVFAHPQAEARQMVLEAPHASVGAVRFPGFPYKLSGTPAQLRLPPPLLGEHTEEVLSGLLGLGPGDVRSLRERRVV